MKKLLLFLSFITLVTNLFAIPTYFLQNEPDITDLREKGGWIIDETGSETIDTLINRTFNYEPKVGYGITQSTIWGKYRLTSEIDATWIFYSRWHKGDIINFYGIYPDGTIIEQSAGISAKNRNFNYRRPSFQFNLKKGESIDIYLSINSKSSLYRDFKVTGPLTFFKINLVDERIIFSTFAAILVLSLYNLMVFFNSKDKNYLYYFLYIIFMFMYNISVEGFGGYYLWPGWEWFIPRSYNIFMGISFTAVIIFARSFLNVKAYSRKLDTIFKYAKYPFIMETFLFMLPLSNAVVNMATLFTFLGVSLLLFASFFTLSKGYKPARYYTLAWIFLISGTLITTCRRLNILPNNTFTEYAIYFGTVIEAVLLAFALGARYRYIQDEKLKAEEALIDANNKVMQNRMKPHFLFNSMNVIFYQFKESPDKAMNTLKALSDNFHYITEFNDKKLIQLNEELDFLNNYLKLMKSRWPELLDIDINIDPELLKIPVPPMILQPLAENAFKYGLKDVKGKKLSVEGIIEDGKISLLVRNNTLNSLGEITYSRSLGNIRDRLRRYYNDANLTVSEQNKIVTSKIEFSAMI